MDGIVGLKQKSSTPRVRRYGRFRLYETQTQGNMDELAEILAILKIVPIRTEYMHYDFGLKVDCYCSRFRELDDGERIPNYSIIVQTDEDGSIANVQVSEEA